ncbi:MAG TPA: hypothetical protein VIX19_08360 [Terriglobales bacterium]
MKIHDVEAENEKRRATCNASSRETGQSAALIFGGTLWSRSGVNRLVQGGSLWNAVVVTRVAS